MLNTEERNKRYPRTFHWITSPGLQNDDRRIENTKDLINHEVIILEKLDGGNCSLIDGRMYARTVDVETVHDSFAMVKKHHRWKTLGFSQRFIGENIYGIHSIEYDPIPEEDTFRLFAIIDDDKFMAWDDIKYFAKELNFAIVPELFRGTFSSEAEISNWFSENIKKGSRLGGKCEGFVMRRTCDFNVEFFSTYATKYVRKNHVQTNEHWRTHWKPCKIKN